MEEIVSCCEKAAANFGLKKFASNTYFDVDLRLPSKRTIFQQEFEFLALSFLLLFPFSSHGLHEVREFGLNYSNMICGLQFFRRTKLCPVFIFSDILERLSSPNLIRNSRSKMPLERKRKS